MKLYEIGLALSFVCGFLYVFFLFTIGILDVLAVVVLYTLFCFLIIFVLSFSKAEWEKERKKEISNDV